MFAPSLSDCLFAALLMWLFIGGEGGVVLLADGDTGWHIRTGDYILQHGSIPHKDIFSYTKPDEPWFAWEWLSEAAFAAAHGVWGLKGVVLLAGTVLCATTTVLFARMLSCGGNLFVCLLMALLANASASVHYLARPHIFTLLFLATSLWILHADRRRPGRAIWLLAPLSALWVNIHGGFAALFACLGLIVAG
ncbi:MAG: hypothetical protein ABIZ80_12475, partial [Bryobacteraceae bacterium]